MSQLDSLSVPSSGRPVNEKTDTEPADAISCWSRLFEGIRFVFLATKEDIIHIPFLLDTNLIPSTFLPTSDHPLSHFFLRVVVQLSPSQNSNDNNGATTLSGGGKLGSVGWGELFTPVRRGELFHLPKNDSNLPF